MLSTTGKVYIILLLAGAVFFTGRMRVKADLITEPFRNDFREMMYLPRGKALKVIASGFDTPLADALFIKSLIYYAESFEAKNRSSRRAYTFELFDVITELSPRFYRAYQTGGLFLSASVDVGANENAVRLLEKGAAVFTRAKENGEKMPEDPRWLFHLLIANTYEVNIQSRLREHGDLAGSSEARRRAGEHFILAAKSPGAPAYVISAATGYELAQKGSGTIEQTLEASLAVWYELYNNAQSRGDSDILPYLEDNIEAAETDLRDIASTREIARVLSEAGREYTARQGRPPLGVADLLDAGLLPGRPASPLSREEGAEDTWVALPDGSFKSTFLSNLETRGHSEVLFDAIVAYQRSNSRPPASLDVLIEEKYLDQIPVPPLAAVGQEYVYHPDSGLVESVMPAGPALPPERR